MFGQTSDPPVTSVPDYKYQNFIRTPDAMGASSKGTLTALSNDVKAMLGYVDVLVSGKSTASAVSPLGNKYFMYANTTCTGDGANQPRYVFINNIPDGTIPLLPGTYSEFKGLVPGLLEGAAALNPTKLFSAFSQDNTCQKVVMNVRSVSNVNSTDSKYVLNADLQDYNPCWFVDRVNPVTKAKCSGKQGFQSKSAIPNDPIVQFYAIGVGVLAIFLVYRFVQKKN